MVVMVVMVGRVVMVVMVVMVAPSGECACLIIREVLVCS